MSRLRARLADTIAAAATRWPRLTDLAVDVANRIRWAIVPGGEPEPPRAETRNTVPIRTRRAE